MIDRILWKVGQLQTCWSFPDSFHIKALTCKLIHITSCMWTDRLNWKTFTFSVSKSSKYPSSWPEIQRTRASKYIFQVGYIDKMNYRTFLCKSYWKELKLLICRRGILKTWGFAVAVAVPGRVLCSDPDKLCLILCTDKNNIKIFHPNFHIWFSSNFTKFPVHRQQRV